MKEIILNILKEYKDYTALSEGHYEYMISGDDETLEEIAQEIEKELKINLVD